MRVTGLLPRGYPGDHRTFGHGTARDSLRSAAGHRAHDGTGRAALPHALHVSSRARPPDEARPGARPGGRLPRRRVDPAGLVASGTTVLGRRPRWLPPLARQMLALYPRAPGRPSPRARRPTSPPVRRRPRHCSAVPVVHPVVATQMLPNRWRLPVLDGPRRRRVVPATQRRPTSTGSPTRDTWPAAPPTSRLQHYRVSHRVAPSGAIRVLEAPKPRLKAVQRRLLARGRRPASRRTTRPGASGPAARCGPTRAPRRPERRAAARPRGVLRERDRLPRLRHLAHRRLPRAGRALPGRPGDQRPAALGLARGPDRPRTTASSTPTGGSVAGSPRHTCRRVRPRRRPWPTWRPSGSTCASPRWPVVGRALHAVRRRPGVLGRPRAGAPARRASRRGRGRSCADEGFRLNARKTGVMPRAGRQTLGGLVVNEQPKVARAPRSTCCGRSCTTATATDRARRTVTTYPPSRSTCAAGSRGSRSTTRCAGRRLQAVARRDRLEPMTVAVGASA